MADLIDQNGNVYRFDDGAGVWRHVPDVDTANALGVDWNNLGGSDGAPQPLGDDWPSVDSAPAPSAPESQPAPQPAPQPQAQPGQDVITPDGSVFRYDNSGGGWRHIPDVATANAMGVNWNNLTSVSSTPQPFLGDWSTTAPVVVPAPVVVTTPYVSPQNEPVPKSLGEALQAYIKGGATPAQAAAQTEALRAEEVKQGVSSVTTAQLQQAAVDVAVNLVASGDIAPIFTQPDTSLSGYFDDSERELESARPKGAPSFIVPGSLFDWTLPNIFNGQPTAKLAWSSLIRTLSGTVSDNIIAARTTNARLSKKVG